MFEHNPVIDNEADNLFRYVFDYVRGDILLYSDVSHYCGYEKDSPPWKAVTRKLRLKLLRERNIATMAVDNVGFKFCTDDEQLNVLSERRQKRATKQLSKTLVELKALKASNLSDHDRRVLSFRLDQVRTQRRLLKSSRMQQKRENIRTETIPPRTRREPVILVE